jgi:predicted ArsR family transcriptional regulator
MGLIAMSERDLQRIEILSKVIAGRMTLVSAAHVLDLSTRQVRRLLERISTGGAASIRHKAIGRPSNNRISDGVRDYAVTLVRERYADFGPTLAAEKLAERDGLHVSRETPGFPKVAPLMHSLPSQFGCAVSSVTAMLSIFM